MQRSVIHSARPFFTQLSLYWCLLILAGMATPAQAGEKVDQLSLPAAQGDVVLLIDGAIARSNSSDGTVHLDFDLIQRLPTHSISTHTAVTDGVKRFDGVLMRDLLEYVGANGSRVAAQAHNGYTVDIPFADFQEFEVLLATHMDGERLKISGKGPFWIVYPRDVSRKLQDIRYDYRWVWQLNRLTVK